MKITYDAKDRGFLRSGHVVDDEYEFLVGRRAFDRRLRIDATTVRALAGNRRTQFNHLKQTFRCLTPAIETEDDNDDFLEFWTSVAGGETFTVDPKQTSLSDPDIGPITCKLDGISLNPRRVMRQENTFRYAFGIEQV